MERRGRSVKAKQKESRVNAGKACTDKAVRAAKDDQGSDYS